MKNNHSKYNSKDFFVVVAISAYVIIATIVIFIPIVSIVFGEKSIQPDYEGYQNFISDSGIKTLENNLPLIFDSNNTLLTKNISYYKIYYDNTNLAVGKDEEVLTKLDELVKAEGKILAKYLEFFTKNGFRHNDIAVFTTVDKGLVGRLISSDISKYFKIEENINRAYDDGENFSSILGYYTSNSSQGMEAYLSEKFKNANIESVNLTVDKRLQDLVYEETSKFLNANSIKSGLAVFSTDDGRILSSVSLPSFDPNAFSTGDMDKIEGILKDPNKPLLNRLYDVVYPSGSIMKLLTSVSALEKNRINPSTIINSEGCMEISEGISLCEFTKLPYGNLDLRNALRMSSNIFFCKLFKEHGLTIGDLNEYQQKFGLGKAVELEVLNESVGVVPTPKYKELNFAESWYLGDSCNSGIGQGYTLVSPAQMLRMVNTIADDGKLSELHFISHILDKNGAYIKANEKKEETGVSNSTLEVIRDGMKLSAQINGIKNFVVYSKTGTAEVGNNENPHTWLIGYYESVGFGNVSFVIFLENGGTTKLNIGLFNDIMEKISNSDLKKYAGIRL